MWFVELVRAVAWPIAVVIIALGFKPELITGLPAFLRRKMEIDAFGVKAKIEAAEQQQAVKANPATEKLSQSPALQPSSRPPINIMEARLRADLETIDADKKQGVLLRALAVARVEYGHEFTYNRIFGSQIAALKRLNEVGQATADQAREFFKPYAERFPQIYDSYGFDGWLGFLKGSGLVIQNGNAFEISDFGRDFLFYLTDRRLMEGKAW